ncbi:MAG: SulP family inorganic anion transporter [Pirellulales bacterium]
MSEEIESKPSNDRAAESSQRTWTADATAGFLVFLVALPLCLAIANASGFPPVAGVLTAIVGGLVTPWLSNSELTIKGPAAGLIVIVAGCAASFGWTPDDPQAQLQAYRCTLAVGVIAGCLQIGFALLRTGIVSEFFPTSVVHGMLAAIGVIILSKQSHLMLGATPTAKSPLGLLAEIPHTIMSGLNPEIALIGIVSLAILFLWPRLGVGFLKRVPAPLVVVLVSIPLAAYFDLDHPANEPHRYQLGTQTYEVSDRYLVSVPGSLWQAITTPDFSRVFTSNGLLWIGMFCIIGSLESILSAKAVDLLDPQKRRTDFNRDLLAIGVANTLAAAIGGLPMISEIVRSRANIDNGAKSRYANMFHALFLLVFLLCLPGLIHRIPLAALAAMLVYTGFRLASPREFMHMYHVGVDQLVVFVTTIIGVLATDLLVGILIGTVVKLALHVWRGVTPRGFFRPTIDLVLEEDRVKVKVADAAVFSYWIALKRRLAAIDARHVQLDFSHAKFIDHTVLANLEQLRKEWAADGRVLEVCGLDEHLPSSSHPQAARRKTLSAGSTST